MKLSPTQLECLKWLADDSKEFGCRAGRQTLRALRSRGLAFINGKTGRWEITDVGRIELGPISLTPDGNFASL